MPKRYTLLRTGVLIGLKSSKEDYVDEYKNEKNIELFLFLPEIKI